MSSTYTKNNKELAGLEIVPSESVWQVDKKGKATICKDLQIVGKVQRDLPNFIVKANNPQSSNSFIDDTSALPKAAKKKLVDFFMNGKKKKVAYLARTDLKSKTTPLALTTIKPKRRNKNAKNK